jgi:hypothetical protein
MRACRERHRARWDETSETELRARLAAGEFAPAIARAMGRSQEAIRTRANILGIPIRFAERRVMSRPAGAAAEAASAG